MSTAKRILERLGNRLHHRLSKFDRSGFLNLKPISAFFAFIWLGFSIQKLLGVHYIMIFEKKPYQLRREILIQVVVILLEL